MTQGKDRANTEILNVLYQSSDRYSLPTAVSIASLLESNQNVENISIFLISDGISTENIFRISQLCNIYGRQLHLIQANALLGTNEVYKFNLPTWNGSLTTYCKLFAIDELDIVGDVLIYLDSDTLINKSLKNLISIGEDLPSSDKVIAGSFDYYFPEFHELSGANKDDFFINAGVLVINQVSWKRTFAKKRILQYLQGVARNGASAADQEIINNVFRNEIEPLDPTYNFNSGLYLYGVEAFLDMYRLDSNSFVNKVRLLEVMEEEPAINHCMVEMCGRPWEKDNRHPQNALFDKYLELTPWTSADKIDRKKSLPLKLQYAAFRILPMRAYRIIYPRLVLNYFKRSKKKGS